MKISPSGWTTACFIAFMLFLAYLVYLLRARVDVQTALAVFLVGFFGTVGHQLPSMFGKDNS